MKPLLPACKEVGKRRYREIAGLYYEDFEPGDVFEHRPGRTILDVDNSWLVHAAHDEYAATPVQRGLRCQDRMEEASGGFDFHTRIAYRYERAYGQR
jgi:hypothetical protein